MTEIQTSAVLSHTPHGTLSESLVLCRSISVAQGRIYTNVPPGLIIGPQRCFMCPFVGQNGTYLIPTVINRTKTVPLEGTTPVTSHYALNGTILFSFFWECRYVLKNPTNHLSYIFGSFYSSRGSDINCLSKYVWTFFSCYSKRTIKCS